jgi:sodium-coupled monocarboxylate transporter 8/12
LIKALIGIYYNLSGGRQRTTNEYLLADKQMSIFPVSFSLMASFMSAITLLGVTAENYMYGTQFVAINLSYVIGTPIAAFIFLPVLFQLKLTSVYEVSKDH